MKEQNEIELGPTRKSSNATNIKTPFNSPLNREKKSGGWAKQCGEDRAGHAIFQVHVNRANGQVSPYAWSIRATVKLLWNYKSKSGRENLYEILSSYAPSNDTLGSIEGQPHNSPVEYVRFVSKAIDFPGNKPIGVFDSGGRVIEYDRLRLLLIAIERYEHGKRVTADWEIDLGITLFLTGET